MVREEPGSIALSIALMICIIISGVLFLNSYAAAKTFEVETMKDIVSEFNMREQAQLALDQMDTITEEQREQIIKIVDTKEFDSLVEQYTEYLSEYILNADDTKQVTEKDIKDLVLPYAREHLGEDLGEEEFEEKLNEYVSKTKLNRVFTSADNLMSGNTLNRVQGLLSSKLRNIALVVILVSLLAMIPCATFRRYLCFVGGAVLLAGAISRFIGQVLVKLLVSLFQNAMVEQMLEDYADMLAGMAITIIIAGAVLLAAGIAYLVVTRINRREA